MVFLVERTMIRSCSRRLTQACHWQVRLQSSVTADAAGSQQVDKISPSGSVKPLHSDIMANIVFSRRYPVPPPEEAKPRHRLSKEKEKAYLVYNMLQNDIKERTPIKLILSGYVENLGKRGTVVEVSKWFARTELLPALRAVYCTPENIEKFQITEEQLENPIRFNYAEQVNRLLNSVHLPVMMNSSVPWRLSTEHLNIAFRRLGFVVPANCITINSREKPLEDVGSERWLEYVPPKQDKNKASSQGKKIDFVTKDMLVPKQFRDFYCTVDINSGEYRPTVRCSVVFLDILQQSNLLTIHSLLWKPFPSDGVSPRLVKLAENVFR